jgi:polyhydroxybutyrate depolymerase
VNRVRRIGRAGALPAVAVLALAAGTLDLRSVSRTISSGGRERTYRLYAPPTLSPSAPAALVLVFHGGEGDGASAERLTRFDDLADRDRFLVVYPDGVGKHWNDGRAVQAFESVREGVDDVAFVDALIEAVSREFRVDADRVFATGISNGGIFSNFLGARLASRIAAIAPVAGTLAEPARSDFRPAHPVSVLLVSGTDDALVPYAGGALASAHGRVLGAEETARLWAKTDGCGSDPVKDPPSSPVDECRTVRSRWTGGRGKTEVVLDTIEGGGHTWPGGPQYAPKSLIGRACPEPDATREIWEFFRAHPRVPETPAAAHS